MTTRTKTNWGVAAAWTAGWLLWTAGAAAQEPDVALRIHVRGSAQIEGSAWAEGDGFVLRGTLMDDAGAPIARAPVSIEGEGRLPVAILCVSSERAPADPIRPVANSYEIETDEQGTFCLRGQAPIEKGVFRLRFPGRNSFARSNLYESADVQVRLEESQTGLLPVTLRFDPGIDVIDLDREDVLVSALVRIDRTDLMQRANAPSRREGLLVSLEDEQGTKLAEALTGGDGRVRFEVNTSSLGDPGPGELRLKFDGNAVFAKASVGQPIVRRAQVALALSHALDAGNPEDGVPIDVDVTSPRGVVQGGVVEALRVGESVGVATVQDGKARVIVSFPAGREGQVSLSLRYVPAAPWWRSGSELAVDMLVKGPSVWRHAGFAALVVAIATWVIGSWRRAPKPKALADIDHKPAPLSGRAGVRIMGRSEGEMGWRGTVIDAHDGMPIAGAELSVVVPAFDSEGVVARVQTDDRGAFILDVSYRNDARLVVQSRMHSSYEQVLPPPSTLSVALVTRRRALLDRLVRWARRQGPPFEGPPEPTPGHVRRAAGRNGDLDVERWAGKLEHVAFGQEGVDEAIERDVRSTEPKSAKRAPTS